MTYDSQISTTWEQAIKDWADKLGEMTNWSITNDQRATGHIAVNAPALGYGDVTQEGFYIQSSNLGDGSDENNNLSLGYYYDYTDKNTFGQFDNMEINFYSTTGADNVEYWLQYSDGWGWVWYVRRVENDGNDWSFWVGAFAWEDNGGTAYYDPTTCDGWDTSDRAGGYLIGHNQSSPNNQYSVDSYLANGGGMGDIMTSGWYHSSSTLARGLLHPDTAKSDYVWYARGTVTDENSTNSDTGEGVEMIRFTDALWLRERSGTALNTGDVIQDAGGADEWEIVDYYDNRVAIRMV